MKKILLAILVLFLMSNVYAGTFDGTSADGYDWDADDDLDETALDSFSGSLDNRLDNLETVISTETTSVAVTTITVTAPMTATKTGYTYAITISTATWTVNTIKANIAVDFPADSIQPSDIGAGSFGSDVIASSITANAIYTDMVDTTDMAGGILPADVVVSSVGVNTVGTTQVQSTVTLDTEWDTIGEIETATGANIFTSSETINDSHISDTLTIGSSGSVDDAAIPAGITRDAEWDTEGEVETAWGSVNVLLETEIDASSELRALVDDETGSGVLMFGTSPDITTSIGLKAQAEARFYDSDSSNYIALKGSPTITADRTFYLPLTYGADGEMLATDGVGGTKWAAAGAGDMLKATYDSDEDDVIDIGAIPKSTDTYLASNSDLEVPTEKAVKTYVDTEVAKRKAKRITGGFTIFKVNGSYTHAPDFSGVNINGTDDVLGTIIILPDDCVSLVSFRVSCVSNVAEADGMMLVGRTRGGGDNEPYDTHGGAATIVSTTTNFAANDSVFWDFTTIISGFSGGDRIELYIAGAAASGVNCATNGWFMDWEVTYQ